MRRRRVRDFVTAATAAAVVITLVPLARAGEPAYDRPDIEDPDDGPRPARPATVPPPPGAESGPEPEGPAPAEVQAAPRARPNGLMLGGYVTAGLAVAALAPLIAGTVMASQGADDYPDGQSQAQVLDSRRKIRNGNRLAAAGGIAAGSLGIAAIIMVTVGKQRRDDQQLGVAPTGSADGGGVVVMGRF